jgi:hypothetical protein
MEFVFATWVNEASVIQFLRVDGQDLACDSVDALGAWATQPLNEVERIELGFMHPREMAEETLQTMIVFAEQLATLSERCLPEAGGAATTPEVALQLETEYLRLLDGLQTFSEALSTVKTVLRIGLMTPVNLLEAELLSILRDLFECQKAPAGFELAKYREDLLRTHLPFHLRAWAREGIPAMIRSRDS